MTLGFICGVYVGQEFSNAPRLKPLLSDLYRKIVG